MLSSSADRPIDPQICRQCQGRCCQGHPGVWVDPARFLSLFDLPHPANPKGWQPTLEIHQLELREIDGVLIPAPQQTEQGCILHDSGSGCRLTEANRPGQCLALTPSLETLLDDQIHCHLPAAGSTETALRLWRQFWKYGIPRINTSQGKSETHPFKLCNSVKNCNN